MIEYTALNLFLHNFGTTQYNNYDYTNLCVFNGVLLGANNSGITILDVGNMDNGEEIASRFEIPHDDLGSEKEKRVRSIYLGGDLSGDMNIRVICDGVYSDSFNARESEGSDVVQQNYKIPVDWNNKGRYVGVEVTNEDGANFSVDSIEANITITNLLSKTKQTLGRLDEEFPGMEM